MTTLPGEVRPSTGTTPESMRATSTPGGQNATGGDPGHEASDDVDVSTDGPPRSLTVRSARSRCRCSRTITETSFPVATETFLASGRNDSATTVARRASAMRRVVGWSQSPIGVSVRRSHVSISPGCSTRDRGIRHPPPNLQSAIRRDCEARTVYRRRPIGRAGSGSARFVRLVPRRPAPSPVRCTRKEAPWRPGSSGGTSRTSRSVTCTATGPARRSPSTTTTSSAPSPGTTTRCTRTSTTRRPPRSSDATWWWATSCTRWRSG